MIVHSKFLYVIITSFILLFEHQKKRRSLPNKTHMQTILQEGIRYSIDETENTASVIKCVSYKPNVIIQRTIKYESKEYIVTSIAELRTIEQNAFYTSKLESINNPAHATQISQYTFFACYEHVRVDFEKLKNLHSQNQRSKASPFQRVLLNWKKDGAQEQRI